MKTIVKRMIVLALLCLLVVISVTAQDGQLAKVVDTVNVRAGAGTENALIGQIAVRTEVMVEARNRRGNWVLLHTLDNALRGWVASRYVIWDGGTALENLPISEEVLAVTLAPSAPASASAGTDSETSSTTASITAPNVSTDGLSPRATELVQLLSAVPILPVITPAMRERYASNLALGRDPHNFAKVGDCNTENNSFLGVFSQGNYSLGEYKSLQSTINYYQQGYDSFTRLSFAGRTGHLATTVIDPIYADTVKCPNMSMLQCEYNSQNPAVSLIQFGMSDSFRMDAETFRAAMSQIANDSVSQAVLPIFFTVPTAPEGNANFEKTMEFNLVIVQVANAYNVPVVNFWLAAQSLGGGGMTADAIHPSSDDSQPANFAQGAHNQHAFAMWNLLVLQVLDKLRALN